MAEAVLDDYGRRRLSVLMAGCILLGAIAFTLMEGWPFIDSLYFVTVSLSSVGYGDFTPSTGASRALLVIYVLLFMGAFALLVEMFTDLRHQWLERTLNRSRTYRRLGKTTQNLALLVVALGHVVLLGVILFHFLEGWTVSEAIYFSMITLTTLGYGDLLPSNTVSKLVLAAYVVYGHAVMGLVVSLLQEFLKSLVLGRRPRAPKLFTD